VYFFIHFSKRDEVVYFWYINIMNTQISLEIFFTRLLAEIAIAASGTGFPSPRFCSLSCRFNLAPYEFKLFPAYSWDIRAYISRSRVFNQDNILFFPASLWEILNRPLAPSVYNSRPREWKSL
jgi:hypothetical protein